MKYDLLIHNIGQLLTLKGNKPKYGKEMNELHIVENVAIACLDGKIVAIEPNEKLQQEKAIHKMDAQNRVVMPGFVDPHTHPVFIGTRENEFEWRIQGRSYQEISRSGGGIRSTMKKTRAANKTEMKDFARPFLQRMLAMGTTTAEAKSGYALTKDGEIAMLEAIQELNVEQPIDLIPTFMGAHEIPEEYHAEPAKFLDYLIQEVLPVVKERNLAQYCDIFCEEHVFPIDLSRNYLQKAQKMGFKIRMHADELKPIGGAELAGEIGAVSADHLVAISEAGIQALKTNNVFPILLPGTTFSLNLKNYAPGRKMIDEGLPVCISTDFNPGSCHTESIQIVISLACLHFHMTVAEAITASTINAACSLDLGDKVGSIEIGKQADILVTDMPSYQYLAYHFGLNNNRYVIKNGEVVYQRNY